MCSSSDVIFSCPGPVLSRPLQAIAAKTLTVVSRPRLLIVILLGRVPPWTCSSLDVFLLGSVPLRTCSSTDVFLFGRVPPKETIIANL